MIRSLLLLLLFVTLCSSAFGQKKRVQKKDEAEQSEQSRSTSLQPYYKESKTVEKKGKKSNSAKITYDQQQAYYDRVLAVAKARRKAEKIMEKPQYSNPLYFGHKRPPKKRPPQKMRLCNECGIRH